MAGDDVTITIRANSGDAMRAFRDVNGQLRDLRGRFVSEGSIMTRSMGQLSSSIGSLIPVATAAVPAAAALGLATAKAAGSAGGAVTALAAFGAAVAGQVSHLSEASEAQKKYTDAVAQHGRGSKQAAEAQLAVQASLAGMPAATQQAAVGLQTLKGTFREWSDSTARFTMAPVEKSFTVLGEIIPRLTPMVQGTSTQLERLVDVAGGAVASPGFDALSERFASFANESLKGAVDGTIHFSRVLSEGDANGPVKAFMDYAQQNGPALRETLVNVGEAVSTLVEAAADAGPGMLTLVSAAAGLVASLPPELVTVLMQTAVGLKLVTLAGAGAAAVSAGIATLGVRIAALQAASVAAGGGLLGLRAAFLALGTAAKASVIVAGVAAAVLVVAKLSSAGRRAAPDVDRLTTSLGNLGRTGKVSGEAAKSFGTDLGGLADSLRMLARPDLDTQIRSTILGVANIDTSQVSAAKKDIDGVDKALASLVKGGKADLAKDAFDRIAAAMKKQGMSSGELKKELGDYKSALKDAEFEQQLAAESMGIFGAASQATSAKLEAQKGAADGLRASILALNDVNRSAYDAQITFEKGLDDLTASFKEHGATLNLDTEAGRANGQAMSQAAKSQDELIASGLAAGESLGSMTKKSEELRSTMMRLAVDAFDGNKKKAREYVNTLLGTPSDIKTLVKLEREEAISGLEDVRAAISKTPGKKSVTVDTLNGAAIKALEAVGLKTKRLPDGRTKVTTKNGQAIGSIGAVSKALNNLDGKTARTYTTHTTLNQIITRSKTFRSVHDIVGATGGLFTGSSFKRGYADGGPVRGPGTGTSDDVFAPWLSNGEFVMRAAAVQKYGERFMNLLNEGRLDMPKFHRGGKVTKKEKEARKAARGELTISHFGRRAGYRNPEIRNQLGGADSMRELVSSLNKWRGVIKKTTHGGLERGLLRSLNRAGSALIKNERKLLKVNKALDKAKDKLGDLKSAASQLSSSVKGGILSGANITKGAGAEDSRVTINTLLSQMTGSAANSRQFAGMLKTLKSRGLRGDLIKQIAEAGVEGGGMETAAAVLGGGKREIAQLNTLQKQIASNAKSAGKVAADAMYGAGIRAAEGLVKGLKKKQGAIEKQMMRIAKSMEKSIKRALRIKSPSQVMEEVGDQTAQGFALGMVRNRAVTPAWASMLEMPRNTGPRRTPVPAASGAGGDRPIVLNVSLGGREFGQILVDVGRKEVATRGGLKATFGGLD